VLVVINRPLVALLNLVQKAKPDKSPTGGTISPQLLASAILIL